MKNWLKKIKRSVLIAIALLLLASGAVYALSEVVRDFTASISLAQAETLSDSSLGIYQDADATVPMTGISFGTVSGFQYDIGQGEGETQPDMVPVYIKNQHTEQLMVGINASFDHGTVELVSTSGGALDTAARTLDPNEILPAKLKLTLSDSYENGDYNFTIHFIGQTLAGGGGGDVAPNITSIGGFGTPVILGATMTYTVNGDHFMSEITADISGPGTRVTTTRYISSTQIEVDIVYSTEASDSSQTLTVTNPGGLSDTYTYTVGTLVFAPNITSIGGFGAPIVLGATMTYTVNGDHFMSGITAYDWGTPGITVTATRYISSTQIEVDIVFSAGGSLIGHSLMVINPGGLSDTYTVDII